MQSSRPTEMHFDAVAALVDDAIARRVTPAAVIEVGSTRDVRWQFAAGRLTYADGAPHCTRDTIFDLASLTKVIATTSLAMRAVEQDARWCDTRIGALESKWRGTDREAVTVRQLLDHSSGLPPHVRLFESAHGRAQFLERIVALPLAFTPGTESRYSDVGFILLGLLLEAQLGGPLDALFGPLAARLDGDIGFNPVVSNAAAIAPTEIDPWRGRLLQGDVHDENAAALGGVAGHAGLFGTARAVGSFAQLALQTLGANTWLARRDTMQLFATRSSVPGSSRALGWDTMLPTSSCGTRMSARAIGHTGFTGTSLWIDPDHDIYVVLLTNRVHPSRDGGGIQQLRRDVHDAVMTVAAR